MLLQSCFRRAHPTSPDSASDNDDDSDGEAAASAAVCGTRHGALGSAYGGGAAARLTSTFMPHVRRGPAAGVGTALGALPGRPVRGRAPSLEAARPRDRFPVREAAGRAAAFPAHSRARVRHARVLVTRHSSERGAGRFAAVSLFALARTTPAAHPRTRGGAAQLARRARREICALRGAQSRRNTNRHGALHAARRARRAALRSLAAQHRQDSVADRRRAFLRRALSSLRQRGSGDAWRATWRHDPAASSRHAHAAQDRARVRGHVCAAARLAAGGHKRVCSAPARARCAER